MKHDTTQLEKEISAVKTILDVSTLIIKNNQSREDEKAKLIAVIETVSAEYMARLISKQALEIAVRKVKDDGLRNQIAREAQFQIDEITALLRQKKIIA